MHLFREKLTHARGIRAFSIDPSHFRPQQVDALCELPLAYAPHSVPDQSFLVHVELSARDLANHKIPQRRRVDPCAQRVKPGFLRPKAFLQRDEKLPGALIIEIRNRNPAVADKREELRILATMKVTQQRT